MKLGESSIQVIDGDRGKNYPNQFFETGYCLFLNAKNVTSSGFVFEERQFITKERDELLRKGKLARNDVVLTTRGTVGNVAFYDESVPFDHVRINSGMVILRSSSNAVVPKYLYYAMKSAWVQNQIVQMRTGSAQPQFPISHMLNLEIPLPSLIEQRKIAEALSAIDDKIANNAKINHHLEQMAQAIYKSWFVDFEPWGGVMPESWHNGVLADICYYSCDRIPVSSLTYDNYISTENMLPNRGGFVSATSLPTIVQTTAFIAGDTLISNIRPYFKKIVFCNFCGGCSTDVLCFRPRDPKYSLYIYNLLCNKYFFDYIVSGAKGTKMPRGDKEQIMNFSISIPTDEVIDKFIKAVMPAVKLSINVTSSKKKLVYLRDTLLPRLISGELTVVD